MNYEEPTVELVIEQLGARKADALNTLEMLRAQRMRAKGPKSHRKKGAHGPQG